MEGRQGTSGGALVLGAAWRMTRARGQALPAGAAAAPEASAVPEAAP